MKLYELTEQYKELLDMATDENIDQKTINDTMKLVEMDIEDKAEGYAKVIKSLGGNISVIDEEIARLTSIKRRINNNIDALKFNLTNAMIETGKKKFKTDLFSFNIQKKSFVFGFRRRRKSSR
ncbi:MAG: siphovirus Gp157 family protein [Lachnospiraceae bacterium]|nr:siphovirus Gp157 family protein [Lachnospiraceae bacterium]